MLSILIIFTVKAEGLVRLLEILSSIWLISVNIYWVPNMCLTNWTFNSYFKLYPPNLFKVVVVQFVVNKKNLISFPFLNWIETCEICPDLFWKALWRSRKSSVSEALYTWVPERTLLFSSYKLKASVLIFLRLSFQFEKQSWNISGINFFLE